MKQSLTNVRIAVDARYLARPGMGINEYVTAALRVLRDAGAELTLVTDKPIQPASDLADLPVVRLSIRPAIAMLWEQVRVARFLYANDFDYYFAPANMGLPLLYIGKTKLVLTVHDLIPMHYFWQLLRAQPLRMVMYVPATLCAMLRANRIMAVSDATAADIKRIFRRRAISTLIPLGRLRLTDRPLRPKKVRKPHIIFSGGMDARKNVIPLLHAFAAFVKIHPEYKLFILSKNTEPLQPLISRLGLGHAVVRTGYVDQQQKFQMLEEAALSVYPSSLEGYGLPIVEAMMTRTVIVCGRGGAQAQTGGDAALYADPVTADTIQDALEQATALLNNTAALRAYRMRQITQLDRLTSTSIEEHIVAQFLPSK